MKRHDSRAVAFKLLFEYSFGGDTETIINNAAESRGEVITAFARQLFTGAVERISEIDSLIADSAENRNFSRIGRVPLSCMRLGAYEMLATDTPPEIVVNEALELCREHGGEESVAYVNGVLGKIDGIIKRDG